MADSSPSSTDGTADAADADGTDRDVVPGADGAAETDVDALRRAVEEKYDFSYRVLYSV